MIGGMTTEDWKALSEAVEQRRRELGLTQLQVQQAGGPSMAKIREIENRRTDVLSPSKRRDLERALRWRQGSVDDVLAGNEPTPLKPIALHMQADSPQEEILRAVAESRRRARVDFGGEVDKQADLLAGVRNAWKLAPLAAELGCHPEEVRNFTHSGFGLLLGSGVLGLTASNQSLLAEIVSEFSEADSVGQRKQEGATHVDQPVSPAGPSAQSDAPSTPIKDQEAGNVIDLSWHETPLPPNVDAENVAANTGQSKGRELRDQQTRDAEQPDQDGPEHGA